MPKFQKEDDQKKARVEFYQEKDKFWSWKLYDRDGVVVAVSGRSRLRRETAEQFFLDAGGAFMQATGTLLLDDTKPAPKDTST